MLTIGMVAKRWISEDASDQMHALKELKMALLEDTFSYGIVSAVMLTIGQAEMTLKVESEAQVYLKSLEQVHVNCWFICFTANMLCLYLSTMEYLNTISC